MVNITLAAAAGDLAVPAIAVGIIGEAPSSTELLIRPLSSRRM
jgi:hypothetical protein